MFPGQPKSWVSEGGRTRIHRPRPTLRAGQGPMRTRIGQEVAKGDRQQQGVWLREECPGFRTPWKVTNLLSSGSSTLGPGGGLSM